MISKNEFLVLLYEIPINLYSVAVKAESILAILEKIIETLPNLFSFTDPSCTPEVPR